MTNACICLPLLLQFRLRNRVNWYYLLFFKQTPVITGTALIILLSLNSFNMKNYNTTILLTICFIAITTISFSQTVTDNEVKKNIVPITNATEFLLKLEPKKYEYNTSKYNYLNFKKGVQYGFLAENVQSVFPEMVASKNVSYMYSKNSYRDVKLKTADENDLIPIMVASIKELKMEIEKLKAEVAALKGK